MAKFSEQPCLGTDIVTRNLERFSKPELSEACVTILAHVRLHRAATLIMVDSEEELESLQNDVYGIWLEAGGSENPLRIWTNGREPIESDKQQYFWDEAHRYRESN